MSEPLKIVKRYIDAFNTGDLNAMIAAFAPDGAILDGMAPHTWRGPSAAAEWYRDVIAHGSQAGATGYHVTLGTPAHNDVHDDDAYIVAPATMTFELNGTPVTQTGATFTVALHKHVGAWRIAAWSWSKGSPSTG